MQILQHLHTQLTPLNLTQPYWIAYSGGLDSHVLLNAMVRLREQIPGISLQAIHVDHGLSPQAAHWVNHCRAVCLGLNVKFYSEPIRESPPTGASVEAWAREARYAIFAKILTPTAVVLTAHTQDDQAETVLLQLLRGAGPKGLAAMPQRQSLSLGSILRPFLNLTRQQLQEYAVQQGLSWIEDESNANHRFDRNFLRHRVMPVLRERWPGAAKNIMRSAHHCADAAAGLAELAQIDLYSTSPQPELLGASSVGHQFLSVELLRALPLARQCNVLRYWLSGLGCRLPNTRHIGRIQQDLINGRRDSQPQVSWGRWTIRRYRQTLIVTLSAPTPDIDAPIPWDVSAPLELPHELGQLSAVQPIQGGLSLAIQHHDLNIRFRRGGERCRPTGKACTYPLKKLFQEWRIPPWQRATVPLLYSGDELVSVIGYCICAPFSVPPAEMGWGIFQKKVANTALLG